MTEVTGAQELGKEALLDAYRVMRTIREFEERLHKEFADGEIPGFVHLYAGEEAIAAGARAPGRRGLPGHVRQKGDRSRPRRARRAGKDR